MSINLRSRTMRTIRSACLGTATALVTLLACAPLATAAETGADSAHGKGKHQVITLIGQLAEQNRFPVNPDGPAAQGDRTVVRSSLSDEAGNQVGETGGFCTTTRAALPGDSGGAEECVVTYTLPDGQLTAQGMVFGILNAQGLPTTPPPSFDNAITGGTGKYDRARGSVHADTIGVGKRRFTIDLYL
ncbi:hypothetical protein KV205_05280 [Streptomyces sp. SKN60]|nr:hypothetical protein [Streptomyces sp. SKN60]